MSERKITSWTLGHDGATMLRMYVADELGLGSRFSYVPAGWRRSNAQPPHDRMAPEAAAELDRLVRAHPVLGAAEVVAWLGLRT